MKLLKIDFFTKLLDMLKTDEHIREWLENITENNFYNMIRTHNNYEFCKIIIYVNKTNFKKDLFITVTTFDEKIMKTAMSIMNDEIVEYYNGEMYYKYTKTAHDIYYVLCDIYSEYYRSLGNLYETMNDLKLEFILNYISFKHRMIISRLYIAESQKKIRFVVEYKNRFSNDRQKILELQEKLNLDDEFYNNIEEFCKIQNTSRFDLFLKNKSLEYINIQLTTLIDTLDNSQRDTGDDIVISRKALNEIMDIVNESTEKLV